MTHLVLLVLRNVIKIEHTASLAMRDRAEELNFIRFS